MTSKELYMSTLANGPNHEQLSEYLQEQIALLPPSDKLDLPETYTREGLEAYLHANYVSIVKRYNEYLQRRRDGGARELFANKSQAYYYIECTSPTKLVDGSWLYSAFRRRDLNVYTILQKIYIEEAGEGYAHMNHVYIYKSLLERYSLNQDLNQYADDLFIHGAIQLALGYVLSDTLPEVVGYNLGYEQLPYDLMVISYELDELGIDPYYFSLHVTIDNSSTGHAKNALDAVCQVLERCTDEATRAEMYQRVRRGYALNDLGVGCAKMLKRYSTVTELCKCIANKSEHSFGIHTKMVRIGSRTLNEWLDPELCKDLRHVEALLQALVDNGYIRRGMAAENSRFWQYIDLKTSGVMYGVFGEKEKQLIKLYIESGGNTVEQDQSTMFENDNTIESLIDKYLGASLPQHKHVKLPDPESGDYVPLAELYTNKRSQFLQSFQRYSIRRATADSFCWGRMKKVMPASDKQAILQWLAVQDPKTPIKDHQKHNNTIPVGANSIASSLNITTRGQLITFLNTLLHVLGKYLDPREHYTESGIVMTLMYDIISRNAPLGNVDADIEAMLEPLGYWALLGVCMYTLDSTFLNNTCDVKTLLTDKVKTEEDKEKLDGSIRHAARQIKFDIPGEKRNSSLVRSTLLAKGMSTLSKNWQKLISLLLSILLSFIFLQIVDTQ